MIDRPQISARIQYLNMNGFSIAVVDYVDGYVLVAGYKS